MGDCSNQNKCLNPKCEWMRLTASRSKEHQITQQPNYRKKRERFRKRFLSLKKTEPNETNIKSNSNNRRRLHVSHFVDERKTRWILDLCHEIWLSRFDAMNLMMVNALHSLPWHCLSKWPNLFFSLQAEKQTNIFDHFYTFCLRHFISFHFFFK